MSRRSTSRSAPDHPFRRLSLAAAALAGLLLAAGCGSSTHHASVSASASAAATAPADPAAARRAVTAAWQAFFDSRTPPATAAGLLQDGASLQAALRVAAQLSTATHAREAAQVTAVTFTGPSTAMVTFNLLSNGHALLSGSSGQAVYVDGGWKVSKTTFCTLVKLGAGNQAVPGC